MNPRRPSRAISTTSQEILNYFGTCPACGYPAAAYRLTTTFSDDTQRTRVLATCGQPCGWSGPAPIRQ